MKKLFSRTLALALCAAMLLCCLPQLPVFAASSYPNTHVNTGNMAADIVAVAVTQAGYEAAETLTPANASGSVTAVCENGVYTATVAGIAAKDLDKGIYVAAGYTYDGGSHCIGILAYSIGTYCTASAAGSDTAAALAAATAVYGYYAKGLFY